MKEGRGTGGRKDDSKTTHVARQRPPHPPKKKKNKKKRASVSVTLLRLFCYWQARFYFYGFPRAAFGPNGFALEGWKFVDGLWSVHGEWSGQMVFMFFFNYYYYMIKLQ
jgi:hypothetical protein